MWGAVWSSGGGPASQTSAEGLLKDARDYYAKVTENASEEHRKLREYQKWRTGFLTAKQNLEWKIAGEHPDVTPFHTSD